MIHFILSIWALWAVLQSKYDYIGRVTGIRIQWYEEYSILWIDKIEYSCYTIALVSFVNKFADWNVDIGIIMDEWGVVTDIEAMGSLIPLKGS